MKLLIGFLLKSFFDFQSQKHQQNLRNMGVAAAEKGRKIAAAMVLFAMSAAFVFSGTVVGILELGFQFDRGDGISFTGLFLATSIFLGLGVVFAGSGALISRETNESKTRMRSHQKKEKPEVMDLVEELAVLFLKDMTHKMKKNQSDDSTRSF